MYAGAGAGADANVWFWKQVKLLGSVFGDTCGLLQHDG